MEIVLGNLSKRFAGFQALDGVDLSIASGELIALLGPSGSGKTTLLRIMAGLEFADQGEVLFGNEDMATRPVRTREVGFVFQHYALFKHMTVRDNVSFGLRMRARARRPSKTDIRTRADELLDLVQLSGLGDRFPHQLSGGQRQRVALARALAIDPRVLLLDEPFGALDARVRKDLRRWLRELHRKIGTTTVFVTHDQEEALELADRVVIMNKGRIEQAGSVDEVYEHPATPFVFEFLGNTMILPARAECGRVFVQGGTEPLRVKSASLQGDVRVYVRPADLRLVDDVASTPNIPVVVHSVHRTGPLVRAEVRVLADGTMLTVELPHLHHDTAHFQPGSQLRLRFLQYSVFPVSSGPVRTQEPIDAIGYAAGRVRSRADV